MGAEEHAEMTGEQILEYIRVAGSILPPIETLQKYLDACHRDRTVAPLFNPSEYMRGAKRLEGLTKLTAQALKYRRAFEEMEEIAGNEADPEGDVAAVLGLKAWHRRHGTGS